MRLLPPRAGKGVLTWLVLLAAASPVAFSQDAPPDPATAMVIEPEDPIPVQGDDGGGDSSFQGRGRDKPAAGATAPDTGSVPIDDHNPVGVTGIFNGNITTGGSYDPLSHSAHRVIDDIVVPGSIGKYPLKMTRYYNSRASYYGLSAVGLGPGWSHEYSWLLWGGGSKVVSPQGNVVDSYCEAPKGVSEGWEGTHTSTSGTWRLADGGKVVFSAGHVTSIIDPYGQTTTITYDASGYRTRVTDPAGRYLQFIYGPETDLDGTKLLKKVEAHVLGTSTVSEWVSYSYTSVSPGGSGASKKMLTGASYSDTTSASYTYTTDNVPEQQSLGSTKFAPLLATATDLRYRGPMRSIAYDYQDGGPHGAIMAEKFASTGPTVSSIAPALPGPTVSNPNFPTVYTETRGDSPVRSFTYTSLSYLRDLEGGTCPDLTSSGPPSQFLTSYTDFQGHSTWLAYDTNWYVTSVTDARGSGPGDQWHTTIYERGPAPPAGIGEITKITHPDGTFIQYQYTPGDPHYVWIITDELGNRTIHTRDAVTHRITRTDYKDVNNILLAYEEFDYNNFGEVTRHHLKNGAYVHYQYDSRGLLSAKWEPTANPVADANEPKTTYTYYNAGGGWTDRVLKETHPANVNGQIATETYEYDRDTAGNVTGGRGNITKVTHADGTYSSAGWSQYGNKVWEQNELRQQTNYTYDSYNRVLTVSRVMAPDPNETTTYTYAPSNGTNTNSFVHTTSNPDSMTMPSGILTKYDYDQNYRKISMTEASGTSLAATTSFGYDNVGNLTSVTDPLSHVKAMVYDGRNRKTDETRASGTAYAKTTSYAYDAVSNVINITRPDMTIEYNFYDGLNRVYLHMVPRLGTPDNVTEYTNTQFVYNASGTIDTVIDPLGHQTTFEYDESDRRTKMTYHDGTFQTWDWDDVGNLASRITVGGQTQFFNYDSRNRKTSMWWSNLVEWQWFAYDAASRITTAMNGTGSWGTNLVSTITRTYDPAGRLTLDRQALGGGSSKDITYDYDADGRTTRTTVELNVYNYTYSYDARGRFEKITDAITGQLQYQYYYDAASNLTKRYNWITGVTQQFIYNPLDWITERDLFKGATTLATEIYGRNALGQVTLIDRIGTNDDRFGYYLDGEMNWSSYDSTLFKDSTYTLDKAGNRTQVYDGTAWKTYTPNSTNQYTVADAVAVSNNAEHQISAFDGVTYTYYNDGRLASVSNGTTWTNFYYDALGRCVKRVKDGWDAKYSYYDGERELLECGPGGGAAFKNTYGKGIDEILKRLDTTNNWPLYFQQDANNNVTELTWGDGGIVEIFQYDAFGALNKAASGWGNPFLFTGRRYQSTFGIYEYRARAYSPRLGRFTGEDPTLYDAGDYNLFRYCHNDPLDLTDPMGTTVLDGPRGNPAISHLVQAADLAKEISKLQLRQKALGWPGHGAIEIGKLNYAEQRAATQLVKVGAELKAMGAQVAPSSINREGHHAPSLSDSRLVEGLENNRNRINAAGVSRMSLPGYLKFQYQNNSAPWEFYHKGWYDYKGSVEQLHGTWLSHEINYFVIGEAAAAHHESLRGMDMLIKGYTSGRAALGGNGPAGGEGLWARAGYGYYDAMRTLEEGY